MRAPDDLDGLVARTRGLQPWRRLFHAGNGLILAWLPAAGGWPRPILVAGLAAALVLLATGDLVRLRAPELNAHFFRLFPSLASPRELEGVASSTWFLMGVLLTYAFFPPHVAVPAVLVLALADPAASTLGRLLGQRRLGKGTLEGGIAFFLVAFAVLVPSAGWPSAAGVAAGVALVELLPWSLDDNVTIPLAAAGLLWIVGV